MKTDKFTLFVYTAIFLFLYAVKTETNQNVNIADETLTDYSFLSLGITILNQRII